MQSSSSTGLSAPLIHRRKRTGIIVFGYTRLLHLRNLLESLRRQQTGLDIHVWLDGHSGIKTVYDRVKKCRELVKTQFPEMYLTTLNADIGVNKITLDGLTFMSSRYERIIILEDDCFPTASAIRVFEETLDSITDRPEVYSAYGHHFLTPSEGETITRFQGWGWATTTEKLLTILPDLKKYFCMSEPEYLQLVGF